MTNNAIPCAIIVTYDSPKFFTAKTAIIKSSGSLSKSELLDLLHNKLNLDLEGAHIHNVEYLGKVDIIENS